MCNIKIHERSLKIKPMKHDIIEIFPDTGKLDFQDNFSYGPGAPAGR